MPSIESREFYELKSNHMKLRTITKETNIVHCHLLRDLEENHPLDRNHDFKAGTLIRQGLNQNFSL